MNPVAPVPKETTVGVADMAQRWGLSKRQARRKMLAIEHEHPGTLKRGGGRNELRATAEVMARYAKVAVETRVVVDVRRLRERVKELEGRADVAVREAATAAREAAEFRALAHSWFRRVQALEGRR